MSSASTNSQQVTPQATESVTGSLADRFLGLSGVWNQAAKFGVVGVTTGLLVYLVVAGRQDSGAMRDEAREAHKSMSVMTDVLREEREATKELTRAIKALSVEVRHLKDGRTGTAAKDEPGRQDP